MQVKAKFGVGVGIILVSLSALAWIGARESKTYYHTVEELASLDADALRQRIRVGGDVEAGSIQRMAGRVDFVIKAEGRTLPVSYVGRDPLPDDLTLWRHLDETVVLEQDVCDIGLPVVGVSQDQRVAAAACGSGVG